MCTAFSKASPVAYVCAWQVSPKRSHLLDIMHCACLEAKLAPPKARHVRWCRVFSYRLCAPTCVVRFISHVGVTGACFRSSISVPFLSCAPSYPLAEIALATGVAGRTTEEASPVVLLEVQHVTFLPEASSGAGWFASFGSAPLAGASLWAFSP